MLANLKPTNRPVSTEICGFDSDAYVVNATLDRIDMVDRVIKTSDSHLEAVVLFGQSGGLEFEHSVVRAVKDSISFLSNVIFRRINVMNFAGSLGQFRPLFPQTTPKPCEKRALVKISSTTASTRARSVVDSWTSSRSKQACRTCSW